MTAIDIQRETQAHHGPIRALLRAAFGRMAEADLVESLRKDGAVTLALVAVAEAEVVGHICFSRLGAEGGIAASALAPLAVAPGHQRRGIGTALVERALPALRDMGEDVVLVLGEPSFYGRFGFSATAAAAFHTPYDSPYQQALALSEAGRTARGRIAYARAFSDLA